jgi:hypothetical protein
MINHALLLGPIEISGKTRTLIGVLRQKPGFTEGYTQTRR